MLPLVVVRAEKQLLRHNTVAPWQMNAAPGATHHVLCSGRSRWRCRLLTHTPTMSPQQPEGCCKGHYDEQNFRHQIPWPPDRCSRPPRQRLVMRIVGFTGYARVKRESPDCSPRLRYSVRLISCRLKSGGRPQNPGGEALGRPGRNRRNGLRKIVVGVRGFEPPTPASRTQYSTRLSYTPNDTNKKGTSDVPFRQCVRVTANDANCIKESRYCVGGIACRTAPAAAASTSAWWRA